MGHGVSEVADLVLYIYTVFYGMEGRAGKQLCNRSFVKQKANRWVYTMPTYLRILGYSVVIYSHDHRPAHIHVIGPDGRCVFNLNCPSGPIELRSVVGISDLLLRRLASKIEPAIRELCVEWRKIHGFDY